MATVTSDTNSTFPIVPSSVLDRFLTYNTERIEYACDLFICSACPQARCFTHQTTTSPLDLGTQFSNLQSHLATDHANLDSLICVYCCSRVVAQHLPMHIAQHFINASIDNQSSMYSCPADPKCPARFRSNCLPSLEFHWASQHAAVETCIKCPHCRIPFTSLSAWFEHANRQRRILAHCAVPGCLVKSPSSESILVHYRKKHLDGSSDGSVSLPLKLSVEMLCCQHELLPFHLSATDAFVMDTGPPHSVPTGLPTSLSSAKQKHIFILRCPYCSFVTTRWEAFWQHSSTCGAIVNDNLSSNSTSDTGSLHRFTCKFYWCSTCEALSTEEQLVAEHCNHAHSQPCSVLHETVSIQLPDRKTPTVSSTNDLPALSILEQKLSERSHFDLHGMQQPSRLFSSSDTQTGAQCNGEDAAILPTPNVLSVDDALRTLKNLNVNPVTAAAMAAALSHFSGLSTNGGAEPHPPSSLGLLSRPQQYSIDTNPDLPSSVDSPLAGTPKQSNVLDLSLASDIGRVSDDLVSFPFDEAKFREEMSSTDNIDPAILDSLVEKMRRFSSYVVRILGKENHRRIPACPECEKIFPYGLGDFKRHLLTVHLEVPRAHLKNCLSFTHLPKSECKFQEVQDQLAMRQMKPQVLEPGLTRIPLPYSINILRQLCNQLTVSVREELELKMQKYRSMSALVQSRDGVRSFRCNECDYTSSHAFADVRKHILGAHCAIPTKYFRVCLQASRLDPLEFTLLSDDRLARHAKDFLHQQPHDENQPTLSPPSSPPHLDRNGCSDLASTLSTGSTSGSDVKSQESFISHVTAVVPGSNSRVTVRIRPPVPPDEVVPVLPSPSHSPPQCESGGQVISRSGFNLQSLPPVPGLQGADQLYDLPLPFSERVLRYLLQSAGATGAHVEEIAEKMQTYSTYTMLRICRGDRTVAFRCPCGRLFITTRVPDSKIRPATLADSRRHVMGVHARIAHEFITICCQASRITREHDFKLYSDDMLLRLAMDRPIKLSNLPPCNQTPSQPVPEASPKIPEQDLNSSRLTDSASSTVDERETENEPRTGQNSSDLGPSVSQSPAEVSQFDFDVNDALTAEEREQAEALASGKHTQSMDDPLHYLNMARSSAGEEVERVINLPYSIEALRTLVEGYCPPAYFPVLEDKMNAYSELKVFITRRRGRRYFCCSGCSSASPHGMGDIRKHILGVHAKVPERYKAAAMHCSRLSREDNSLLPNSVLLHLAKMKWKGTVIKPLAEMDLSQIGSRRATAFGLTRQPGGQFASQVYQPGVARDAEKFSALDLGNTARANGRRSDSPPLQPLKQLLPLATDRSLIPTTGSPRILQLNLKSTPVDGLDEPFTGTLYVCSECHMVAIQDVPVRDHILIDHLKMPHSGYQCSICAELFATQQGALSHHEFKHGGADPAIRPRVAESVGETNEIATKVVDDAECVLGPPPLTLPPAALLHLQTRPTGKRRFDANTTIDDAPTLLPLDMDHLPPKQARLHPVVVDVSNAPDQKRTSGSSRRKPNKLQLVQFKPAPSSTGSDLMEEAKIPNTGCSSSSTIHPVSL